MSNHEELATIDTTHDVEMGEALARLEKNADFKKVIMDGYCGEKAEASVSLLAVPQIKAEGRRADIMEDLVSISNLKFYFQMIKQFHEAATDPILSSEEEAELLAEQNEQGVQ